MMFLFFILFFFLSLSLCLLFHLPFHLLFSSLFFSSLFSSLLFSSCFFFSLLLSFFLFLSSFSDNGTHSEKEFQHLSGTWRDGIRSTSICQKPFILSCFVLSSLSSFSVFFLCLLSLSSFSVSVSMCWWCVCVVVCVCVFLWCGVCRVVWHAENPVCRLKTLSVCRLKTSPCMPATRAHAFQHVGVVPLHTGTFSMYTRKAF